MGHLINTFILLAFLTLTAWFASGERKVSLTVDTKTLLLTALGVLLLLMVGLSGSLAALSNMLFPSQSLAEGVAKDFSPTSDLILRLRLSHPILSILASVYLIFLAGWLKAKASDAKVTWWSNAVSLLVISQVIFGGATLLTLGPIVMQLGHLLLADAVWIAFVLLVANYLSRSGSEFYR
jgi:heme A synthase